MSLEVMQVLHQGGGAGSVLSTLHLSIGLARAEIHVLFVCPPGSEVEGLARDTGSLARTVERTRELYHEVLDRPPLETCSR